MTGFYDVNIISCTEGLTKKKKPYYRLLMIQPNEKYSNVGTAFSDNPIPIGDATLYLEASCYKDKVTYRVRQN